MIIYMKTTIMRTALLLLPLVVFGEELSTTSTNRIEIHAQLSLNSLRAVHEQFLKLASNETWFIDYGPQCYWSKPMAIDFERPASNTIIHLQLFNHGTAPLPARSYNTAIIGLNGEYDILGNLSEDLLKKEAVRKAIREAVTEDKKAHKASEAIGAQGASQPQH